MPYRANVTDKEQNDIETQEDSSAIRVFSFKAVDGQTGNDPDTKIIKAYDLSNTTDGAGSPSDAVAQNNDRAQLTIGNHNDNTSSFPTPGRAGNRLRLSAVSIADGGSNYLINDTVTLAGIYKTLPAKLRVDAIGAKALQDESDYDGSGDNGTFDGGVDQYFAGDEITMSDGSVIHVDAATAGEINVVTEFTVLTGPTTGVTSDNPTLTQVSTTGGGTGFTMTLGDANQTIADVSIIQSGTYSVVLNNPVPQDSTSGSGVGATFNATWV